MKILYMNSKKLRGSIKRVLTFLILIALTSNFAVWGQKDLNPTLPVSKPTVTTNEVSFIKGSSDDGFQSEKLFDKTFSSLDYGKGGIYEGKKPENENVSLRNMTSKHFLNADGSYDAIITAGMPLNYMENGAWQTIRKEIVRNTAANQNEYAYANTTNVFKTFYSGQSNGGVMTEYSGFSVREWVNPEISWMVGDNLVESINISNNEGFVDLNKLIFSNCFPNTDVRFTQENGGKKLDLILKNAKILSQAPAGASHMAINETIVLPDGWSSRLNESAIYILNAKGECVYVYASPEFYDSNPESVKKTGNFSVKQNGNELVITTLVPMDWLTDHQRVFPITIDPTSTIYATSGGWQSSISTYADDINILICGYWSSGSAIQRAWGKFNTSTIPDGSVINDVTLALYSDLVVSTTSVTISTWSIETDYGPYGAYNANYYNEIGAGTNYNTYTVTNTGTYGPSSLGATAASTLQTQLVNDRFQVGLTNSNTSGSDLRKRFTGASYIVVTYAANPACGNTNLGVITPSTCSMQDAAYTAGTIPYWSFTATAGYSYHFTMEANSEDSYLRLYDASMTQVAYDDDGGPGVTAFLNWTCPTTGTYYISGSHYSCVALTNSSYMTYWITDDGTYGTGSGNTITPITTWQNQAYTSGYFYYYYFSGTAGHSYDFSLCDNTEDSYMRIYDAYWNQIATADDNGPHCTGMAASITWPCTTTGTYIVAVNNYSCDIFTNSGNLAYRDSPCANVDHGGADWTISANTLLGGTHTNIGTFTINSGVTVTIDASCHSFFVQADNIVVSGTINANGVGYTGGTGGNYGGLWADDGSTDGRGITGCWDKDNCHGLGLGGGYSGTAGSGPGGGGAGGNGTMGYGSKQVCGWFGDDGGMVGGGGGAGGGAGGTYGGSGGAGKAGGQGGSDDNTCGNAGCQSYIEGSGGTGGTAVATYGSTTTETIEYGSGGAGAGGGGRGSFFYSHVAPHTGYSAGENGGAGGGAVRLIANHNLTIDATGSIYVNGANGGAGGEGGENDYTADCCSDLNDDCTEQTYTAPGGGGTGAGGGSGGGIMLKADCSITMNGTLQANGGNGGSGGNGGYSDWSASYYGGKGNGGAGGGGGRIKIFTNPCGSNTIAGTITVNGGSGGAIATLGRSGTGSAGNSGASGSYNINTSSTALPLDGGSVGTDQNVCNGGDPSLLTNITSPSLASCAPSITYQWMSCTSGCTSPPTGYSVIAGATGATYDPPSGLTQTTYYTRRVTSGTCNSYSNYITVAVAPALTINVQPVSPAPICIGGTFPDLSITASGGIPPLTYQWYSNTVNNNTSGTLISGATLSTYTPPGTPAGTLYYYCIVSAAGCSSVNSATATVTVSAPITQTISGTTPLCIGSSATWTSTTGGGTWSSDTPGVATVGSASGLVTGISAGTSVITYSVTVGGCVNTASSTVTITAPIAQTITGITPICIGSSETWTGTTSGGTWTSANPAIAAVGAGTGLVTGLNAGSSVITYSVAIGGCTNTATATVTISAPTAQSISGTNPICSGQSYIWTGTTAGGTWASTLPGIATVDPSTGEVTGISIGASVITYSVTVGGCINTATQTATVMANNIIPTFTGLGPYCTGDTPGTLLGNSINGITGVWSPATISTASAGTTTHTFTPNGGQCALTTTMDVVVNANVSPVFTALGPYCVGDTPGLLPLNSINGITGTWSPATISTASPGTTTHNFTPNGGQCATTATMPVTVNAIMNVGNFISASPAGAVCSGTLITFTANATNPGTSPVYQWTLNGSVVGGTNSTYSNSALSTGDIVVCQVTSNLACATNNPATSNSISMVVKPSLTAGVSIDVFNNPTCTHTLVSFNATAVNGGTIPGYQWYLNGALVGTASTYTNNSLSSGDSVQCKLTSSEACVSNNPTWSNTVHMVVSPIPTTEAGTTAAYTGVPILLGDPLNGPGTISWSPPQGLSDTSIAQPLASPTVTTTYTLSVNNNGCIATDTVTITFGGRTISGKTRYAAKAIAGSPNPTYNAVIYSIDKVIVILKTSPGGAEVARDTSDALGNFIFHGVMDGNYMLSYDKYTADTMMWSNDINAIDISLMKYFVGSDTTSDPSRCFSWLYKKAANVDNNSVINAIDIARMKSKVGAPYDPVKNFPKGNWIALSTPVTVSGADVNINLETICYGDYNASSSKYRDSLNTWNGAKSMPGDLIIVSDESLISTDNSYIEVPLKINSNVKDFSALGLELNYQYPDYKLVSAYMPGVMTKGSVQKINPTLEEIIEDDNDLLVTDDNGIIRVVYATTHHFDVASNDDIITFRFRSLKEQSGLIDFPLTGTGVVGDQYGNEIPDVFLSMPKLYVQNNSNSGAAFEFSGYPNPFTEEATIYYNLPENGTVNLKVYNSIGELVSVMVNETQLSGKHTVEFSGRNLPAGMYTFKIEFEGLQKSNYAVLKMLR
ncbi:MAG TPA: T9SS type A sorting domain-containing protein [Bacteroidales bacterium]|nr:T9SS type A sorting domain-containing protein [Bacteroidales bacterium]